MGSDDGTIGRVLTRREALALLGAGGVTALGAGRPASAAAPGACVVRPALTEGPYFVDVKLDRSDIRSDPADGTLRPGVPLHLALRVSRLAAGACVPLPGAMVDVWHCDAAGLYSDVTDRGGSTVGRKFLRGYQTTGGDGRVAFTTIYPGAYPGRAVHVHFKVRTDAGRGRAHEFTSQLFFDDALTDLVHARPPYAAPPRRMRNERDGIYRGIGGQLILAAAPSSGGYAAAFDLALEVG
ncbi:MAG TPA: intradiol ring-cleavage dioxygenase [Methylomirabilota bacterium]|nr:intradiol ring-cleavage dioxygenase [Methylomirabilota bacterium]